MTVAALYVERGGPYYSMADVDPWDIARDARKYAGPHPVVAHPPCGAYGRLRHLRAPRREGDDDSDCGPIAVDQARRFGGVLEQPAGSLLWRRCGVGRPGSGDDEHGGFSIELDQVAWGHCARKPTWLYLVRVPRSALQNGPCRGARPTHWVSGGRRARPGGGGTVPPGIKVCSAQQRRRTPPAFAAWLVEMADAVRYE